MEKLTVNFLEKIIKHFEKLYSLDVRDEFKQKIDELYYIELKNTFDHLNDTVKKHMNAELVNRGKQPILEPIKE